MYSHHVPAEGTGNPSIQERFQVEGENRRSMGKISKRPMIMQRARAALERPEKALKFPMGPTISRPGPTLLTEARAAVTVVVKENPSREMTRQVRATVRT